MRYALCAMRHAQYALPEYPSYPLIYITTTTRLYPYDYHSHHRR